MTEIRKNRCIRLFRRRVSAAPEKCTVARLYHVGVDPTDSHLWAKNVTSKFGYGTDPEDVI